jgi:hypothetical protein
MKVFKLLIFLSLIFSCGQEREKQSAMIDEKAFTITDSLGNSYKAFRLSFEEFNEYKKEGLGSLDSLHELYGMTCYETKNGQVIVEKSGKYALYPSVSVLEDIVRKSNSPRREDLLFNKNPFGNSFPDHSNELVKKTLDDFRIDSTLGRSEILSKLDSIVINNRNESFFENHYLGLIAIVGNLIIQEYKAEWNMVLASDKVTWHPYLMLRNHKVYFIHYIMEDFFNSKQHKPITEVYETVAAIIRTNIPK